MGRLLKEGDSSLELQTGDPIARMKLSSAVAARRAQFVKYVAAAVGLAVLLCAAAVVKVALAHGDTVPLHPELPAQTVIAAVSGGPESAPVAAALVASAAPFAVAPSPLDAKAPAKAKAKSRRSPQRAKIDGDGASR